MAEHGLLFSGPMVRALLDGSKTMTRRAVSRHNSRGLYADTDFSTLAVRGGDSELSVTGLSQPTPARVVPRIQPGDTIWVRETFQPLWADPDVAPGSLKRPDGWAISYPATDGVQEHMHVDKGLSTACTPGIFLPRWASRITLRVTKVFPERALNISAEDVKREGVTLEAVRALGAKVEDSAASPFELWSAGWAAINGEESLKANPWCWVYVFEVVR